MKFTQEHQEPAEQESDAATLLRPGRKLGPDRRSLAYDPRQLRNTSRVCYQPNILAKRELGFSAIFAFLQREDQQGTKALWRV